MSGSCNSLNRLINHPKDKIILQKELAANCSKLFLFGLITILKLLILFIDMLVKLILYS